MVDFSKKEYESQAKLQIIYPYRRLVSVLRLIALG